VPASRDDDEELSNITHPVMGERVTLGTVRAWMRTKLCFNCLL
jgi:hypothetical protein